MVYVCNPKQLIWEDMAMYMEVWRGGASSLQACMVCIYYS